MLRSVFYGHLGTGIFQLVMGFMIMCLVKCSSMPADDSRPMPKKEIKETEEAFSDIQNNCCGPMAAITKLVLSAILVYWTGFTNTSLVFFILDLLMTLIDLPDFLTCLDDLWNERGLYDREKRQLAEDKQAELAYAKRIQVRVAQ